jgi:hypothetical protein
MNRVSNERALRVTVCVALLNGCGGNVNLGGKAAAGSAGISDGGAPTVVEVPDPAQSVPVAKFAENFSFGTLALAGEYLYLSGLDSKQNSGLYRCDKRKCDATLKRLPNVNGSIFYLQIFEQSLGVANFADGAFWLGSYALPDASNERIAIGNLPGSSPVAPLFHDGFVFFSVDPDEGAYRCSLPDCSNAPKRIGSIRNRSYVQFVAEGSLVFWTDGSFIYRAGANGDELPRTLVPDAMLSDAAASSVTDEGLATDGIISLAVGAGWLYAAVTHSETRASCDSFCPQRMERWPASGGAREVLFDTDDMIRKVFLLDGELAWLGPSRRDPGNLDAATLTTCRVEACDATRRELGEVRADFRALVADEQDLYWLAAEPALSQSLPNTAVFDRQIRCAPRLPPP